jgi:hypothetical protein
MALAVNDSSPVSFRMPPHVPGSLGSYNPPATGNPLNESSVIERLHELRGRHYAMIEQLSRDIAEELTRRGESIPFPVSIESVRIHGGVRSIRGELIGQVVARPDGLELEVPELHIIVAGPDFTTLQEELFDELDVLYDQFVRAPESELAPSGIALRNKLRALLEG